MRKIKLRVTVYSAYGACYPPGIYMENNIPSRYRKPEFITYLDTKEEEVTKVNSVFNPDNSDISIKSAPLSEKDADIEIKPSVEAPQKKYLLINEVDLQTLIDLDGVGKATAQKIVDLRKEVPFLNYLDLQDRVHLSFGRKWTDYNIQF